MVSVAIVMLLALFAVTSLDSSKKTEELRTVARQLVSDVRSVQARALSAQNIKTCTTPLGDNAVCEDSAAVCVGPCALANPGGFGIHFEANSSTYILFADVNADAPNFKYTNTKENLVRRRLADTSQSVIVEQVMVPASVANGDIVFLRQSATPHVYYPTMVAEPNTIVVRLKHTTSNATLDVEINRVTGRVSIL